MTRNLRRSLVCSSVALALGFAPSLPVLAATAPVIASGATLAAAPDTGDPEALSAAAVEKFEAKEYDAAVDLFEQAYAADPQPNYLFNIGRVYEEKGDLEKAVEFYQRFVGQSGVDLESRQAATERLKVLREAVAQMKANEEATDEGTEETTDEGTEETTDEGTEETTDEGATDDTTDEQAAKRKKILRITGYSLLGAGGGALIVGAIFGGLASSSADEADADPFVDRTLALRDRARGQARVADAMFITGGILAAAGLALVLTTVGRKKASTGEVTRRTRWSPVIGPQRVGVGVTHRF
ncbi:MAG: tetratricopeptide repeat protein [Nannocystaceae bacterium]